MNIVTCKIELSDDNVEENLLFKMSNFYFNELFLKLDLEKIGSSIYISKSNINIKNLKNVINVQSKYFFTKPFFVVKNYNGDNLTILFKCSDDKKDLKYHIDINYRSFFVYQSIDGNILLI
ncbi:MAG: hypothetical protein NZZ41_03075 [Candidatus Dojkabacteria bacterium]|nr:hypothetical protein [Candidatus Dojkabacteria bacterium]